MPRATAPPACSMATRPVGPQFVSVDEYDVLVYPGFLRRTVCVHVCCTPSLSHAPRRTRLPRHRGCTRSELVE